MGKKHKLISKTKAAEKIKNRQKITAVIYCPFGDGNYHKSLFKWNECMNGMDEWIYWHVVDQQQQRQMDWTGPARSTKRPISVTKQ